MKTRWDARSFARRLASLACSTRVHRVSAPPLPNFDFLGRINMSEKNSRRGFLKQSMAATAGAALGFRFEEINLEAQAARKGQETESSTAKGSLPMGKIGSLKMSRVFCGGNLTSGIAHSRDMIYVSSLLRSYFTDRKVFETWQLCEEQGINTAILRLDDHVLRLLNKYWREVGGKMQWIAQVMVTEQDIRTAPLQAIDQGALGVFVHGGVADSFVTEGKVDLLGKTVELIKDNNVLAGLAGHALEVPMSCEKSRRSGGFLREDAQQRKLLDGRAPHRSRPPLETSPPRNVGAARIGSKFARQHVVHYSGADCGLYENRQETLDRLQSVGRGCHPPEGGIPVCFPEWCRLYLRGDVRFPGE